MFGLRSEWYDWSSDASLSLDGGIALSTEKVEVASDNEYLSPLHAMYVQFTKRHSLFIDGEPLRFFRGYHNMSSSFKFDFILLACKSRPLTLNLTNNRWWCRKYCRGRNRPAKPIRKVGHYAVGIAQERYLQTATCQYYQDV